MSSKSQRPTIKDGGPNSAVKVAVRIRPQNPHERQNSTVCVAVTPDEPQLSIGRSDKKSTQFTYDHVFDQQTHQQFIYDTCVSELVDGTFKGYNATVLAYGQTGSGKTYTMGTSFDKCQSADVDQHTVGIIPRMARHFFEGIEKRQDEARKTGKVVPSFEVTVQFIELYKMDIVDLLSEVRKCNSAAIKIHEDPVRLEIYLSGVASRKVHSPEDILKTLKEGAQKRKTAATNMNQRSSRSHAIFTVKIKQSRVVPVEVSISDEECGAVKKGMKGVRAVQNDTINYEPSTELEELHAKFHFVDLAGSERLSRTGATGDRAKEARDNNLGLLELGNVIEALCRARGRDCHVPYRNSNLTRLLQGSLGGNSRTVMIACASPSDMDYTETLNTLTYANRAKNIKNKVVVNQNKSSKVIQELRQRIQEELDKYQNIEAQLNEMTANYQYEKKQREEFERNKRLLELEQKEGATQSQEEHDKLEHMNREMAKLKTEASQLRNKSDHDQATIAAYQKQVRNLESQYEEARHEMESEKKQKISLQSKLRQMEQDLSGLSGQQKEKEKHQQLINENSALKQQLKETQKKAEENLNAQLEEHRKRMQKELADTQQLLAESEQAMKRVEQSKKKAQQEIEDLQLELASLRKSQQDQGKKRGLLTNNDDDIGGTSTSKLRKPKKQKVVEDELHFSEEDNIQQQDELLTNKHNAAGKRTSKLRKPKKQQMKKVAKELHQPQQVEELDESLQFSEEDNLSQLDDSNQQQADQNNDGDTEEDKYQCPKCQFSTKHKGHYKNHLLKFCKDVKYIKCDFDGCIKACATKQELERHKSTHDKPYECLMERCSLKFDHPRELEKHNSFHIGKYKCWYCRKGFKMLDEHRRHVDYCRQFK